MKIEKLLLISFCIILAGATLSGCKKDKSSDLNELLTKSQEFKTISYEMVTNMGGQTSTIKIYIENENMRNEAIIAGRKSISIINSEKKVSYTYDPETNLAMKVDFDDLKTDMDQDSPIDMNEDITQYSPILIGEEKIDGKNALVYELNMSGNSVKEWIWEDNGLILKMEMGDGGTKVVYEFKNYDFSDIDDALFELPAGAQIMDLNAGFGNLPNMPDFPNL